MRRKSGFEKALRVPAQLTATAAVLAAASCAPMAEPSDVAARDATQSPAADVAEVPRIDGGCYSGQRYLGQNRRCFPSYPAVACRAERACRTSECGEGCALCNEVFQCFPMVIRPGDDASLVADAAPPRCDSPRFTCDRYGCEPGCQTIPAPVEPGGGLG